MARAHVGMFLAFCLVIGSGSERSTTLVPLPPHGHGHGHGPAFLLPLSPTRRHLAGSHAALMSLHHELSSGYSTTLFIGTPPQEFAVTVDSATSVTYVPCSTCYQCGLHQEMKHPRFDPELSSTYEPVACDAYCRCDGSGMQCIYETMYDETSINSGVLGRDVVSFGDQTRLDPQRLLFGCGHLETGFLYDQRADGVMGLGRGNLSIVDQLVQKGVISDSFSLCYGGMDDAGGAMVLGAISPPSDMVFTKSERTDSPYYNIELKAIHVAGKRLPLDPKVFKGKHGTVLSSSIAVAYLPEAVFLLFKAALMNEIGFLEQVAGLNEDDICFYGGGSDISELSISFPAVDLVFSNGQIWPLPPENYLFRQVDGAYCLGIYQNGLNPTTLLGGIVMRNTLVTYDREHKRVGFWKTNCSDLWKRLQISYATPALPPASSEKNSTIDLPPTMAPTPSTSPDYTYADDFQVGRITFYMSTSTNYSSLKPHISKLTKFLAHDLDVSTSQIHLLDFISNRNETLLKWTVIPADYARHFSNATAMRIMATISEHRLQLPDTFGTCHVFNWNVKPPPEWTWQQQRHHDMASVMTGMGMIIIGLSASGMWYIWRRRRRQEALDAYQPVGVGVGGVTEQQELSDGSVTEEEEPVGGATEQELADLHT